MRVTSTANAPSSERGQRGHPVAEDQQLPEQRVAHRLARAADLLPELPQRLGELGDRAQEVEQLARLAADRVGDQPEREAGPPAVARR